MTHRTSTFLSFGALLVLLVLYVLTTAGLLGDNPVGQTGSYSEPLVVPAGYAFSIWGIIYLGLIIFPIFQFFRRQTGHVLWIELRQWYSLNVIANGLWLVLASYDWLWMSVAVILFMLYSLVRINDLLIRISRDGGKAHYWADHLVFSIYFAWITLATVLNISAALHFYEWGGFGLSEMTWALIILPVTALIAGFVFRKYRDVAYAAVVIWAFLALVVKHINANPVLAYLSILVIIVFAVLIFMWGRKPRQLAG